MARAAPQGSAHRIAELDGLRGIAIILVLLWHFFVAPAEFLPGSLASYAVRLGMLTWSGVDLFFVLSGFLIGGILLDTRSNPEFFTTFYARRFFRIIPLYATLCALYFISREVSPGTQPAYIGFPTSMPWYVYLSFTQNFWIAAHPGSEHLWLDVTWSLAIEEHFYLLLPLVVRYVPSRKLPWVVGLVLLLSPICRSLALIIARDKAMSISYFITPCRADPLMLGILAAQLTRMDAVLQFLTKRGWLLEMALAIFGLILLLFVAFGWNVASPQMITAGYSCLALSYFVLLLIAVTQPESPISCLLRIRPLTAMGTIAYCVYLIHLEVLYVCHHFALASRPHLSNSLEAVVSVFALALAVTIAFLSWTYFERPLIRLGYKIARTD